MSSSDALPASKMIGKKVLTVSIVTECLPDGSRVESLLLPRVESHTHWGAGSEVEPVRFAVIATEFDSMGHARGERFCEIRLKAPSEYSSDLVFGTVESENGHESSPPPGHISR